MSGVVGGPGVWLDACVPCDQRELLGPRCSGPILVIHACGSGSLSPSSCEGQRMAPLGAVGTLIMHHTHLGHGSPRADDHHRRQQRRALN